MDIKKKEEVSFDMIRLKSGVTTVQAMRTLFEAEGIMKLRWAGTIISNRKVPIDRVPDKKITKSLEAKEGYKKKQDWRWF